MLQIVIFRIVFLYFESTKSGKKWKIRIFRKFQQKKVIFEAKKLFQLPAKHD